MNGKIYLYSLADREYKYLTTGEYSVLEIAEKFKIPFHQQLLEDPDHVLLGIWEKNGDTFIDYGSWDYYLVVKEAEEEDNALQF